MNDTDFPFKETEEEKKLSEEYDSVEYPPKGLFSYDEPRSCADILRLTGEKDGKAFNYKPSFQRETIWTVSAQTRFIDSLIQKLPIPSMCISYDLKTRERNVIDGRQRISTIIKFLADEKWKLSKLEDVDPRISNQIVEQIKEKHNDLYSIVKDALLPITVIGCDHENNDHLEYLFKIFHRLNTGGVKLNNQEIRNCIYSGRLNNFLKETVEDSLYQEVFSIKDKKRYRFTYEELNLRFLAFSEDYKNYTGKLNSWLNDYMKKNRNIAEEKLDEKRTSFNDTLTIMAGIIDKQRQKGKHEKFRFSRAFIEAVYVGINRNIEKCSNPKTDLLGCYENLQKDGQFAKEMLMGGVAQKDKVINRLDRAVEIFE